MAADLLEALRAALSDRYTIESELGRGGNAIVYLAHDVKHDRKVALKVLLPELALAVRAERFLREIQIAARLSHPHILPLYDSGDAGGTLFYVMPYVAGETLRDRLNREKQLTIEDVLRIARDVGSALTAAHAAGVVHRDIKPENILLAATGEAVVADFGIARALTMAAGQGITESGIAVGTPAYMSPEQATGGEVDGRTDVYALGCVTYEMLAGRPPFSGATSQEVLMRHTLDPVPSLRAARAAIPESVETAVQRALAKQPADRFATPKDFAAALSSDKSRKRPRFLVSAGVVVLLAVAIGTVLWWRSSDSRAGGSDVSLAIREFTTLMTELDQDYLAQGITEDLTALLAQIDGLRVFPVRAVQGQPQPTAQALHRRDRADRVVEGSVRKTTDQLRVTVRMIDARDGTQVWGQSFTRNLKDALTVQTDIAASIAGALRVNLAGSGSIISGAPPRDAETLDLYYRARHARLGQDRQGVLEAIVLFEQALARDSMYALAWSGLAEALRQAGQVRYLPRLETWARAESLARRAVELDSMLSEAHVVIGRLREGRLWDDATAEVEYRLAIKLNPKSANAHASYAQLLALHGQCDLGIEEARKTVELAELDRVSIEQPLILPNTMLYCQRDLEKAEELFLDYIRHQPEYASAYGQLGLVYFRQKRFADAVKVFATAAKLNPGSTSHPARVGYALAQLGQRDSAVALLRMLEKRLPDPAVFTSLAELSMGLGDTAKAFTYLDRAVASRDLLRAPLLSPIWDPVRSEPRFRVILAAVGLALQGSASKR